jgi:hypothetical protein
MALSFSVSLTHQHDVFQQLILWFCNFEVRKQLII